MLKIGNLKQRYFFGMSLLIGLVYVTSFWRMWEYGAEVFGLNLTFIWLLVIGFFVLAKWETLNRDTWKWLIPFTIIVLSFSFYKNPYTTWISFLLAPVIFFLFTTHESHSTLRAILWSKFLPFAFIFAGFKFLTSMFLGFKFGFGSEEIKNSIEKRNLGNVTKQVIFGLGGLFLLSLFVIIPLLSSVDENFGKIFEDLLNKIFDLISAVTFAKIIVMVIVSGILLGALHYWRRFLQPFRTMTNNENQLSENSIMMGIILAGVFFLYLTFICVQIQSIFNVNLSTDFSKTEDMVKSGFWQLFLLTIINIIFYALVFKKYVKNVQLILVAFTISSLLLIVSAGYRVFLYVANYGLSYEKAFAFWTVIFCSLVFVWFISLFFQKVEKRVNIISTLSFFALWMYAILTIIPLERIIFTTNLRLTQNAESRVNLNELRMLGFDALPVVEKNFDKLIEEARKDYLQQQENYKLKYPKAHSNDYEEDKKGVLHELNFGEEERKEKEIRDKEKVKRDLENEVDRDWNNWVLDERKDAIVLEFNCDCGIYCDIDDKKNLEKNDCCYYEKREECSCCEKIEKKWYEKAFGEIFYQPLKKLEYKKYVSWDDEEESKKKDENEKEVVMKTFKNPALNFSLNYPSNFKIMYEDFETNEDLINHDGHFNFEGKSNQWNYENNLIIEFFSSKEKNVSWEHKNLLSLFNDNLKNRKGDTKLPNLKKPVYFVFRESWIKNDDKNMYKLVFATSDGIFSIHTNKFVAPVDINGMSLDRYLNLMTEDKEIQNIIKSFTLIPIEN